MTLAEAVQAATDYQGLWMTLIAAGAALIGGGAGWWKATSEKDLTSVQAQKLVIEDLVAERDRWAIDRGKMLEQIGLLEARVTLLEAELSLALGRLREYGE